MTGDVPSGGNDSPQATDSNGSSSSPRRRRQTKVEPPQELVESLQKISKPRTTLWRIYKFYTLPSHWYGHIIPVELSAIWRRHVVWAKRDGNNLLQTVTARLTSTTVFLSLLVSAEIVTFFSPSHIVTVVRQAMVQGDTGSLEFWTGITLSVAIFFSIAALLANFTALSIFLPISKENAAIILRSSIGLYAAQLPSRLVVIAIYFFVAWLIMFWFLLMPLGGALGIMTGGLFLISHIASTYSAIGEVIMASGAMHSIPIISQAEEEKLTPRELYHVLLNETHMAKIAKVPVNRQYRIDYQTYIRQNRQWREEFMIPHPPTETNNDDAFPVTMSDP